MKVTYQGYYGAKNSGDDAFVEVASWGTKKYWGCTDHIFFAAESPKISTDINFFSPHKNYFTFLKSIYEIFRADVFISAGGSTFHSALKKTDLRTYAKAKKTLIKNAVIGAIGISLGPYVNTEAEKNMVSYLKHLNFLALRDKYSFDLACSYNLPYKPVEAFDLAGLLPNVYPDVLNSIPLPRKGKQKIIGVSVCNYERYVKGGDLNKEETRNKYFTAIFSRLINFDDVKFRFFIFNGNAGVGDEEVTLRLIAKLKIKGLDDTNYEVIPYLADVKQTWVKIKECDLIISTRLHASIFACFADVPFFLIEYHKKCADFLNDVGYHRDYRLFDGSRNIDEVVYDVGKILFDGGYKYPVNKLVSEKKALLNFTETFKFISQ